MSLATSSLAPVPASALVAMDSDDFAELVKASIGKETDPVVWDALTDPAVIARTKTVLGGIHADVQTQLTMANTDLWEAKAEGLAQGEAGRLTYYTARAEQAEWRRRAIGFRRLVEQRLALVRERMPRGPRGPQPNHQPTGSRVARIHYRDALEQLARAVAAHQDRVTSGEGSEDDDDTLWALLDEITAPDGKGGQMPLAEWLEWLDEIRGQGEADRA